MARAIGARSQLALAFETVTGIAPVSGFRQVPFVSSGLGADQPLLESEVLGFGRDPQVPVRDAITVDGDVSIPMDAENMGLWLKATFGQPTPANTVAASGSITFDTIPVAGSTITMNGTVFTFVASGATGNQANIGVSVNATLQNMQTILSASVIPGVSAATYTRNPTQILIAHNTLGLAGNAYTLAASGTSGGTVSAPTLTNGAVAQTYASGSFVLPTLALELQMPEVPRFSMYTGCAVDEITWEMKRKGLLTANVKLIGQKESPATASAAGVLTALNQVRFGNFNGAVQRNGVALANILSAKLTYKNNLEPIDAIRNDGNIEGVDPSMAMLSGSFVARFDSNLLFDQAIAATPCSLTFVLQNGPGNALTLTAHEVYLPRPRVSIDGPQGIQATFDWVAAKATLTPFRMCTVVLTSGVGTF
jgi:hypothetical protein